MPTRLPDWQERLTRFLSDNRMRPFRYGSWDCCLFVADAIVEMTGTDPAADFRGQYASRRMAYQLIRDVTGKRSVRAVAERLMPGPQVPMLYARRGDVVLIQRANDYSLGLVSLSGTDVLLPGSRGFCNLPLSSGLLAWHV